MGFVRDQKFVFYFDALLLAREPRDPPAGKSYCEIACKIGHFMTTNKEFAFLDAFWFWKGSKNMFFTLSHCNKLGNLKTHILENYSEISCKN